MIHLNHRIEIRNGFEQKDRQKAATLYVLAFKTKFERIIGNEKLIQEIFEKVMNPNYCLCAYDENNHLVGISGFHEGEHGLLEFKMKDFIQTFGFIKGIWKGFLTDLIFSRKAKSEKELLMDGIAVDKDFRGQGIGSQLFESLIEYGKVRGYKFIKLDVIDENPRAKALYERLNFKKTHYEIVPNFISKRIGVSGVTTMVREM